MTDTDSIPLTVAHNIVAQDEPQKFGLESDSSLPGPESDLDIENDLNTVDEALQALDSEDLESAELLAAQLRD